MASFDGTFISFSIKSLKKPTVGTVKDMKPFENGDRMMGLIVKRKVKKKVRQTVKQIVKVLMITTVCIHISRAIKNFKHSAVLVVRVDKIRVSPLTC